MTVPIWDGKPSQFPELPTSNVLGFQILSGRKDPDKGSVNAAFLFARHDTLGLCLSLSPNKREDDLATWTALYRKWKSTTQASTPPSGLLGEPLVFTALLVAQNEDGPSQPPDLLSNEISEALQAAGLRVSGPPYQTREGLFLWAGREQDGRRVIVIVAHEQMEQVLDRFVWWMDEHELVPFGRYLTNATKLDYEQRVYPERKERLERCIREVDEPLEAVLEQHRRLTTSRSVRLDDLLKAQDILILAQEHSSGLTSEMSRLRDLQRTINIARQNMLATTPAADSDEMSESNDFFGRDQRVADGVYRQIEEDLGYSESVLQRARGAQSLTSLRIAQAADRQARLQSRLTLLQTTVLGALLSALAGIGSLRIHFRPRASLEAPLLASLVTLLLASPVLAAHWLDRYRFFDYLVAASFGAALAWLLVVLVWENASVWIVLFAILAGVVAASLLTRLHNVRR